MKLLAFMPAGEVWKQEPRHETWARTMESFLSAGLERDLQRMVPEVKDIRVECKTTICRVNWLSPAGRKREINNIIDALFIGSGGGLNSSDKDRHEKFIAYSGGVLGQIAPSDTVTLFEKLKMMRAANLRAIKNSRLTGRAPLYATVPASSWPEE